VTAPPTGQSDQRHQIDPRTPTNPGGETETEVYDLVGIGFGPSNLALAIALDEQQQGQQQGEQPPAPETRPLRTRFFERQPRFGWHRGMLIDDATMQVSFLKDLVTMRNPGSDFSFVAYLHEQGRLVDFINHKTLFPLRIEFHDYLEWAARRMAHVVSYSREVIEVLPVLDGGVLTGFDVVVRHCDRPGDVTTHRARNLVVAAGLEPSVPPEAELGERVWHNLDLLRRVETLPAEPAPRRLVVVGAGQSAAEAVEFLHRRFPEADVHAVFSRYGYTPADDSPFANGIFDPEAVDLYFEASGDVKRSLFDYHRNTNYSVVDQELIDELYRRVYQERVQGRQRLHIMRASKVVGVDPAPGDSPGVAVTVEFLPTGARQTLDADVLVYATGYRPVDPLRLLGETARLCRRDEDGLVQVDRDYTVRMAVPARGAVYLQGGTEHSHGITSTLLSNTAVRCGEIATSLAQSTSRLTDDSPRPRTDQIEAETDAADEPAAPPFPHERQLADQLR
jgi:L-ornithine N5-oxygenase